MCAAKILFGSEPLARGRSAYIKDYAFQNRSVLSTPVVAVTMAEFDGLNDLDEPVPDVQATCV